MDIASRGSTTRKHRNDEGACKECAIKDVGNENGYKSCKNCNESISEKHRRSRRPGTATESRIYSEKLRKLDPYRIHIANTYVDGDLRQVEDDERLFDSVSVFSGTTAQGSTITRTKTITKSDDDEISSRKQFEYSGPALDQRLPQSPNVHGYSPEEDAESYGGIEGDRDNALSPAMTHCGLCGLKARHTTLRRPVEHKISDARWVTQNHVLDTHSSSNELVVGPSSTAKMPVLRDMGATREEYEFATITMDVSAKGRKRPSGDIPLGRTEKRPKAEVRERSSSPNIHSSMIEYIRDVLRNHQHAAAEREPDMATKSYEPAEMPLNDELDNMSLILCQMTSSPEKGKVLNLPSEQLLTVMDVLQTLVDGEYGDHRLLERFLKKLVKKRECLPSYLFLKGIRRVGTNAVIGGGYADVWKGLYGESPVAVKVLRIFDRESDHSQVHQEFCKEAMIWRQLKHPNILPFYGVCDDVFAPRIAMVSPWMVNGDLKAYLGRHDDPDRKMIVKSVAIGLRYLHTLTPKVVHGDLRAVNVLVDENHIPRIADFGLTKVIDSRCSSVDLSSNGKGAIRWQAPELISPKHFEGATGNVTSESDVYAYACVCLEVFTGEFPFSNLRDGDVIFEVVVHDRHPPRPYGLDDCMWILMHQCWKRQPVDRPDMCGVVDQLTRDDGFQ